MRNLGRQASFPSLLAPSLDYCTTGWTHASLCSTQRKERKSRVKTDERVENYYLKLIPHCPWSLQHIRARWREKYCLCYHIYMILRDLQLKEASAFAYSNSLDIVAEGDKHKE